MAILKTILRKVGKSTGTRASYEVSVVVEGPIVKRTKRHIYRQNRTAYIGDVHRRGTRRWVWGCSLPDPEAGAPIVGREDTRAEAVTALLAHVREGKHPHLTEPPESDLDAG